MAPLIDPASITQESIPIVLGVILTEIRDIKSEQTEIKDTLKDHADCLEIFKFSRCKVMPWMGRNKWIIAVMFTLLSIWFSSIDWLNRWLQWVFFPPRVGP